MTIAEKIAEYVARGAIQLSRKYRHIGVPPQLEKGQTYLDILREKDPTQWKHFENDAREMVVRFDASSRVELSFEEFNEWLRQTGRTPNAAPPAPFNTWREYWDAERGKGPGVP